MQDAREQGYAYGGLLPDWLAARAARAPQRLAIRFDRPGHAAVESVTYADLEARASVFARRLRQAGVAVGDRVAVLLPNGLPFVEAVFGVGRVGAVLVPLNLRLAPAELAWQIGDVEPSLLLYDDTTAPLAQAALAAVEGPPPPTMALSAFSALSPAGGLLRDDLDLAGVHTIIYTSGTTGRPKGAQLTYGNHWWSAIGSVLNLGLRDDDRWLAALPLFHVSGLSILMRGVIYGIPVLLHDSFDAEAVDAAIDRDGVTAISVVATMLRRMLDLRADRPYPPTLRVVLLGGGPAPLALLHECAARGVPVVQTYGMTETASQAVTLAPGDALRKVGSAGKPLLPLALRIERDGQTVAPGEEGEIVLRGPTVTPGYFRRPVATTDLLHDGWLHTGDLGYLDAEGYLYVLDRRSDLIISGGENVYPAEVEATLLAHPAVLEAGVTGEANERWGQVPVGFVVLRPGQRVPADELLAFCQARLARYKIPARIVFVDTLPHTAAGKVQRYRLLCASDA